MSPEPSAETAPGPATEFPRPRRGARWRWAAPRGALLGGGVLAAVLALGPAAGAATSNRPDTPSDGAPGTPGSAAAPPGSGATRGGGRPTVMGRITALGGDHITVAVQAGPTRSGGSTTATVVYSASTTFTEVSSKSRATSASSSKALKVGEFVAVRGTRHGDSIQATAVLLGSGPPPSPRGTGSAPRVQTG